jgi:hypothetical protein
MTANVQTLADTDDLRKILFSSNILCVEGKEDKILIDALFDYLIHSVKDNEKGATQEEDAVQIGKLKLSVDEIQYITSHQIVALGSYTMEGPVRRCCQDLEVSCTSLLDLDAFVRGSYGDIPVRIHFKEPESEKLFTDLRTFYEDSDGFDKLAKLKEKNRIFFWKVGRLEEVILKSLSNTQIKEHFGTETVLKPLSEFEFADKKMKKSLKKCLLGLPSDKFRALIQDLIGYPEMIRFFKFLKHLYNIDAWQMLEKPMPILTYT